MAEPAPYTPEQLSILLRIAAGKLGRDPVQLQRELQAGRLDALHYAIDHAQEGDLIAVIGKGHEAYRDREGVKTPFLERELIEEYAAETGVE